VKITADRLKPALVSIRCMLAALMLPMAPLRGLSCDNTIGMTVSTRNRPQAALTGANRAGNRLFPDVMSFARAAVAARAGKDHRRAGKRFA